MNQGLKPSNNAPAKQEPEAREEPVLPDDNPSNIFFAPIQRSNIMTNSLMYEEMPMIDSIVFLKVPNPNAAPKPAVPEPSGKKDKGVVLLEQDKFSLMPKTLEKIGECVKMPSTSDVGEKTSIQTLRKLYDLLCILFCRTKSQSKDFGLTQTELQLLNLILRRKAGNKNLGGVKTVAKEFNFDELVKAVAEMKSKRPEECLKFVFSRGFKHLMKRFDGMHKKKAEAEKDFYNTYFSEVAAQREMSIQTFYNPISLKNGSNTTNFNQKYFSAVFKSPKFLTDFLNYIKVELIPEYRDEIKKKARDFAQKVGQNRSKLD